MKKPGTIEYELLINEPEGHGVVYKSNIDTDLAALLITCQTLQHSLESNKELKNGASGQQRAAIAKNISSISVALSELNKLTYSICQHYEEYQKHLQEHFAAEEQVKKEELQKQVVIPLEQMDMGDPNLTDL